MENEGDSSELDLCAVIDSNIYPDLIRAGGLISAVLDVAAEHHIGLGDVQKESGVARFTAMKVTSGARSASILLAVRERRFSIVASRGQYVSASGNTDDILSTTRSASCWLNGMTSAELVAKWPFMHHSPFALACEKDDAVEVQWNSLLEDDDFIRIRPTLEAVHASGDLRLLFPVVSHNTQLRLYDDINIRSARQFWITMQGHGMYRIEVRGEARKGEVVSSLPAAIEKLASYVRRR